MDLARGLAAAGHSPMIWVPTLSLPVAAELVSLGIPVMSRLEDVPSPPDVIHGHHHLETIEALRFFPRTPAVFVSHHGFWWHDAPPRHPNIRRYIGVDQLCCDRLLSTSWMQHDRVSLILNAVDLDRFRRRAPLPTHPRRALIFSNYAAVGTHLEPILEACRESGIEAACAGSGVGQAVTDPHRLLMSQDLVFAKARCALEAMAVGCAVVLCDTAGLGAMVQTSNMAEFRLRNYGFSLLTRPFHPGLIREEIQKYDSSDAAKVTDYIRQVAPLEEAVNRYVAQYRLALDEWPEPGETPDDYPNTERLQTADQARLTISLRDVPETVCGRGHFMMRARIANQTGVVVATAPPWPCFLMYRWIDRTTGETVVEHGLRSILQPPLLPGSSNEYPMCVIPPERQGDCILRVTVIQEGWRWLDTLDPKVCAEATVCVRGSLKQ